MRCLVFLALTAVVLMNAGAFAQNGDSYIQLTRISLIEGNPGYQRVPDEEWSAASVNMPLEPGDRIYTGRSGRIEIEFEEGSVLRLAENTDIEFLAMDEDFVQIRMLLGIASITVEKDVIFEIASPSAAFTTERNGLYRFEVAEDGGSYAIVRKGRLEAAGNNFTRIIMDGDLIHATPGGTNPTVTANNRRDAWDEWTDRRDADRRPTSAVRRYIPDNVSIGVTELDRHGRWIYVTNYGWGWSPYSVASGWSPYSVGRWVYRPRFGWTWVSYESWGWLPYHYGRWYRDTRAGWVWIPGDGITFRFWSPGLVVFYKGTGWVSWGPLGPGDYYDMSYYRYRRIYANDLARLRVLVVRQPGNYINRNVRGAFQTVSMDHFRGVSSGVYNARRNDISQPWRQGTLVRGGLDVSPTRESFRPAPDRQGERSRVEPNRQVVARRPPPQSQANAGRVTQINNPRASREQAKPPAERGNNNGPGSPEARRPGENRNQVTGSRPATPPSPSENRPAARPSAGGSPSSVSPARENTRPAAGDSSSGGRDRQSAAPSGRSNTDSPTRDSSGENRDRTTGSRPATPSSPASTSSPTENRPSARPGTGGSSPSPPSASPARENGRPSAGENSSGGRNRQEAAPVERNQSRTQAAPAGRSNTDSSSRNSAGENRQSARANTGESSSASTARENSRTSAGENSSGGRNRQEAAPAQRSQSRAEAVPADRGNNGSSIRGSTAGSSAGQRTPGAGRQNDAGQNRNRR